MIESAELVTPEQEAEFQKDLATALTTAVEKRDRIGAFLAHCESQAALAAAEIKRLQDRKKGYQAVVDRLETYIIRVIEDLGTDAKGKSRKLEGRTVSFGLRGCAASVKITNEEMVPAQFKTLTITLPAVAWQSLLECVDPALRAQVLGEISKSECDIPKAPVKAAIDAGEDVPGADLLLDRHSLVRK